MEPAAAEPPGDIVINLAVLILVFTVNKGKKLGF